MPLPMKYLPIICAASVIALPVLYSASFDRGYSSGIAEVHRQLTAEYGWVDKVTTTATRNGSSLGWSYQQQVLVRLKAAPQQHRLVTTTVSPGFGVLPGDAVEITTSPNGKVNVMPAPLIFVGVEPQRHQARDRQE